MWVLSLLIATVCATQNDSITRIAFGSCNHQERRQDIWPSIVRKKPDAWVWLGDVIYADTRALTFPLMFAPSSIDSVQNKYTKQKTSPGYAALASQTTVYGVWDDHDYGINDGGIEFENKQAMQQLFLDFLDVPEDSLRRRQEGVYTSHRIGKGVLLILLDVRYHREDYGVLDGDMLGATQWQWLRHTLATEPGEVILIGGGIQFISDTKPVEHWARHPAAREKFFQVLAESKRSGIVLLSGDIHIAETHRLMCNGLGYPLYEFTSSGLSHHNPSWMRPFVASGPTLVDEFYGFNFGVVDVDWVQKTVHVMIHDIDGSIVRQHVLSFAQLEYQGERGAGQGYYCESLPPVSNRYTLAVVRFIYSMFPPYTMSSLTALIMALVLQIMFTGMTMGVIGYAWRSYVFRLKKKP